MTTTRCRAGSCAASECNTAAQRGPALRVGISTATRHAAKAGVSVLARTLELCNRNGLEGMKPSIVPAGRLGADRTRRPGLCCL